MFFELLSLLVVLWVISEWWTSKDMPPGPFRFPIFGNMLQLAMQRGKAPFEIFQNLSKEYGPIMRLKFGFTEQVVIDDLEISKKLLNSDIWADRYLDGWIMERSFGEPLGILFGNQESWKELRRFTLRTLRDFGFGKQKTQETVMEEELRELMSNLNKTLDENNSIVNMSQFYTISVLNILWSMMAGERFSHDDARLTKLVQLLSRVMRILTVGGSIMLAFPILRFILPKLTGYGIERRKCNPLLREQFTDILKERRALGHYKEEQRDFIDVFMKEMDKNEGRADQTNYYTEKQFIIVTLDLFVAGSETTGNTIEFAILYMILNQRIQRKVQEEIDRVVGRNRFPTMADKPSMPYTEAVLCEVQRLANVAPLDQRTPFEDTTLEGYRIKKGTFGIINLYSIHRNPKIWENPLEFYPERFLDKEMNLINTNLILPFGYGKRICMGEVLARSTLFTFFTTFLQNYTFEKVSSSTELSVKPQVGLTLAPQPYHALIKPRL